MLENYISISTKGFSNFTEQELKANRTGQLTAGQIERMKSIAHSEKNISKVITWVMLISLILLYSAIYIFDPSFRKEVDPYAFYFLLAAWGLPLLILLISYFLGKKRTDAFLAVKTVSVVMGKAKKKLLDTEGFNTYEIMIENVKFLAFQELYDLIDEESSYAFYYVPAVSYNLILSWEKF